MNLATIDWIIIGLFFLLTLIIGLVTAKKSSASAKEFFLSGQNMPWWLLGVSMVATTFSADTPNLVTDFVRNDGVSGNWAWWAFLITGMTTVFIYAKLWRRSEMTTDLEFYELRYSGPEARVLRGFRSIYLGVLFNVIVMSSVMLAGIKISAIMLGLSSLQTVLLVSIVTVVYSSLGGLRGVILTDFFQFVLSMIGMVAAAIYIVSLPEIGGLANLISHPAVAEKTSFLPDFGNKDLLIPLLIMPLAVQWWSAWYPGSEPGGGSYVAQRMLSAKNEKDATKATLFFNVAHYALRPWPWILIALASLVVFPDLDSIQATFPSIDPTIIKDDIAFPAMLTFLPKGLVGLVVAALIAALMSTISSHLNWGASYMVHDFYHRFINEEASEAQLVTVGRISTVILMVLAAILALYLQNAQQIFKLILQIGAGTGLLFLLRWFWWRINAYSEISAMVISLLVAIYFELLYKGGMADHERLLIGVDVTTSTWLLCTLLTRPTDKRQLRKFYQKIRPHRAGWSRIHSSLSEEEQAVVASSQVQSFATEIVMVLLGCIMVYALLFGTGFIIYGQLIYGVIGFVISALTAGMILKLWK